MVQFDWQSVGSHVVILRRYQYNPIACHWKVVVLHATKFFLVAELKIVSIIEHEKPSFIRL